MITTVLLDAGGVILDETEHERIWGEIVCDVLSPFVSDYSLESYLKDVDEAIQCFCPSVSWYVMWKHSSQDLDRYNSLLAAFKERWN